MVTFNILISDGRISIGFFPHDDENDDDSDESEGDDDRHCEHLPSNGFHLNGMETTYE